MKIIVISLPDAIDRRIRIKEQLDSLGLEFEFLDAIRGTTAMYDEPCYLKQWRQKYWGTDLTIGEIGCYKSHQLACQRAVELNQAVLVLEDDLLIKPDLKEFLMCIDDNINNLKFDLLRISGLFPKPFYKIRDCGIPFIRYLKHPHGTQGYIIKPHSAKQYLEYLKNMCMPIDDAMDNDFAHKLTIYGYLPYLVEHDYGMESNIGHRGKSKISKLIKLNKQILRSWWSFNRLLWNIKNYLYYKFVLRMVIK